MPYRYKYSHEQLDFIKVRQGAWQVLHRWLLYFLGSVVLAVLYYFVFSTFFNTPKERGLMRENKMLITQYASLNERFDQLETVLNDINQRDNSIYRTIFQAEPLPLNIGGIGGAQRYEELEAFDNADLVIMTDQRLQNLMMRSRAQILSLDTIEVLAKSKELECLNLPAIQPLRNKDLTRTGGSIGMRIHPRYKVAKMHTGIDLVAATGVDVMATGGGTVIEATSSLQGYGNKIVIDHEVGGYTTLYAHLSAIKVKVGQKVKRWEIIGAVGNTGMSIAPHLHYEVRKNNEFLDPLNFFFIDVTPEEYDRMILLATNSGQSLD
jgi:murein DD-endopeptidase MepM/ murein hydrolase activator NlpD